MPVSSPVPRSLQAPRKALTSSPHIQACRRNYTRLRDPPGHRAFWGKIHLPWLLAAPPQPSASVPKVGETQDRKAAQQGRPVMVSEPRTQTRTPAGRAKGLNQPKPEQPPSRSAPLQPLCFRSWGLQRREEKENSTLSFDLAIVCGQRQHCTFTRLILGRAPAAGRGHRWWISVQILPPDPLQPHQLPCEQQLSMSSGEAIDGTQLTRCSHSLPSQAGSFPWHSHTAHGCAQRGWGTTHPATGSEHVETALPTLCQGHSHAHRHQHCPNYRALPEKPCEGPKRCYSKAGQHFWARTRDPSPATETCDTPGEWDSP